MSNCCCCNRNCCCNRRCCCNVNQRNNFGCFPIVILLLLFGSFGFGGLGCGGFGRFFF